MSNQAGSCSESKIPFQSPFSSKESHFLSWLGKKFIIFSKVPGQMSPQIPPIRFWLPSVFIFIWASTYGGSWIVSPWKYGKRIKTQLRNTFPRAKFSHNLFPSNINTINLLNIPSSINHMIAPAAAPCKLARVGEKTTEGLRASLTTLTCSKVDFQNGLLLDMKGYKTLYLVKLTKKESSFHLIYRFFFNWCCGWGRGQWGTWRWSLWITCTPTIPTLWWPTYLLAIKLR